MDQVSSEVEELVDRMIEVDDLESLRGFFEGAGRGMRCPYWMGEVLEDTMGYRSRRCFRWLLEQPEFSEDIGKAWLAGTAGQAAVEGVVYYVRAIAETGVDLAMPEYVNCHKHSEFTSLASGAMVSMKPAIVGIARDKGVFARCHRDCLAEALEYSHSRRRKHTIQCLIIFGQALLDRFRAEEGVFVPIKHLIQMIRELQEGKRATEESIALGNQLEALLDPEEALRAELMVYVERRRPRKMWKLLRQLPKEKFIAMATEILPSVGLYACRHFDHPDIEKDPQRGWRDVEKLLDLGAGVDGVDGVDFSGRTILMNVLWQTRHREDLVLRLVDLGADINAVSEESFRVMSESGEYKSYPGKSVLDFCMLDSIRRIENDYASLLRSLGAKTIEELLEEREEGQ